MATEKQLIEAAQKDKLEFVKLYDAHMKSIFSFLMSRLGDRALAEDLTSETFMIALTKIDTYVYTGKPFSAWLYRIAINEMNQHFRSNKKQVKTSKALKHDALHLSPAADQDLKDKEQQEKEKVHLNMLNEAFEQLREKEKNLLSLRYFDNLAYKEIADVMGITVSNVGVKINRALKSLNKLTSLQTT